MLSGTLFDPDIRHDMVHLDLIHGTVNKVLCVNRSRSQEENEENVRFLADSEIMKPIKLILIM